MMRRPLSLALRLTLLFGIAAAIVFAAFGWVISQSIERHFTAEDTNELQVIAGAVREVLSAIGSAGDLGYLEQRFNDILVGHHDASLYVATQSGRILYTSSGPNLGAIANAAGEGTDDRLVRPWKDANHSYTALIQHVNEADVTAADPYLIVISVPIDEQLRFLAAFRRTLWLMIAGSIILMGIMGWAAVRQGHAPLHDIVGRVRRISGNELNVYLPPDEVPYELADLVISFNEMLQRVDAAFRRLSSFNAHIAHELRTPISNLMTQTQVALSRGRTIDEYREILYSNMEEYEHMAQMVGDMLFLAQTDRQTQIMNVESLDLGREVREVFDYYEGWAEEHAVVLAQEGAATVVADRSMLRRALSNLIDNAIRHTSQGGTVRVRLTMMTGGYIDISVMNPGPEIAPEYQLKLFDPFYRVDASRLGGHGGAGLGLAIVKSVIIAHGGEVGVDSTAGETRFWIILPQQPPSME